MLWPAFFRHSITSPTDPAVKLGPARQCIYCSSTEKLTLEHIIPAGMGGNLEFKDASCAACAAITGRNEAICQRNMLNDPRGAYELSRRKHKDVKKTGSFWVTRGDRSDKLEQLLDSTFPTNIWLFSTNRLPGLLLGDDPDRPLEAVAYGSLDKGAMDRTIQQEEASNFYSSQMIEVGALVRMFAKIAHGYAVSQLRSDALRPFLRDFISLKAPCPNWAPYIGSQQTAREPGDIHTISLHRYAADLRWRGISGPTNYWVVRLHLFAWRMSHAFFIVVGDEPPRAAI